jgi:hypothetical protein
MENPIIFRNSIGQFVIRVNGFCFDELASVFDRYDGSSFCTTTKPLSGPCEKTNPIQNHKTEMLMVE